MEKGEPFKLFPLPSRQNSQVSAVKPQTFTENASFFQHYNAPFGITNPQNIMKNSSGYFSEKVTHLPVIQEESFNSPFANTQNNPPRNSDYFSEKAKHLPVIEENVDPVNQVYSKLYQEAEKIKKWKIAIETELKQKEKKLQESKKTIDAKREVIQELQFENEKLSITLEAEIDENKDLRNQCNATRRVCDLLKDTCTRVVEKANMYGKEREDTRQMYADLNNNIERMIMAFEELCVQAENSRQEACVRLEEEANKRQQLVNEYTNEISRIKHQISELTKEKEDGETKLQELMSQLNESKNKMNALEEAAKKHNSEIEQSQHKVGKLLQQIEEAEVLLRNTENVKKTAEIDLQCTKDLLSQATKDKQTVMAELEDLKAQLEEKEDSLKKNALEIQRKSVDIGDMIKIKDNMKKELEALKFELDFSQKSKTDLEQQLTQEKSTNQILLKQIQDMANNQEKLQEQVDSTLLEKCALNKTVVDLQETHKQLLDSLEKKEKAISDLRAQVNISSEDGENWVKKIAELEEELHQKDLKHQDLLNNYKELLRENMEINTKIEITAKDMTNLQDEFEEIKKKEESAKKQIENLRARNHQARKEIESLQKQLTLRNEEVKNQFSECEGKTRSVECEISKKEKLLKTLENKLTTMKKQMENKNKSIEELQRDNKSLKKKITRESKQCNVLEAEVKELKGQLENTGIQYETTISDKERLIDDLKSKEQHLSEEVDRLKLAAEEARKLQKENDIRCQHKIAEMVALMEKHKNQYDKMVEEKDAALDHYIAMEQEITSKKHLLETHLSNANQEVMSLKEQLKQTIEEKELFAKKDKENDVYPRKGTKDKLIQTSLETPRQSNKIIDSNASKSNSKKSQLSQLVAHTDAAKKSDNRTASPWTSSKSSLYIPQKTYAVKTPPECERLHKEKFNALPQGSDKKKRKIPMEFDFHSDSSERADILGICDADKILKKLTQKSRTYVPVSAATPKKMISETVVKSPGSVLKSQAMKKMREAGWAAVSKVDRRRKMKSAEKLFN